MCPGDRVSAGGGCEAAVTVTRCGWVKFKECGKLLYERKSTIRQKVAVYWNYI